MKRRRTTTRGLTVEQMREAVIEAYAGPAWRLRVMAMGEKQVIAIYKDMLKRGYLDKKPSENAINMSEEGVQMNIWDYLSSNDDEDE